MDAPQVIRIEDVQNDRDVLLQREADFTTFLMNQVINLDTTSLRTKLVQWAAAGFPDAYRIISIQADLSSICSDGVQRNVYEYIAFCAGMPFNDVLMSVQQKVSGIRIGYVTEGTTVTIVVFKA